MSPAAANVINSGPTRRPVPPVGWKPITFAAAAALAAAGCASHAEPQPAPPDSVQSVTIATTDSFRFTPATPVVHVGQVHITLTDAGTYPHNLSIAALHQTSATVSGLPGQRVTTFTATFTRPGRYDFVCTYHSSAGMKGSVLVLKRP